MPLKRKPTLILNSNILAIKPLNALVFSADKTTKNILVESKLPSKPQDD
jgi:hypothetical protein